MPGPNGIEVELKFFIQDIRAGFPEAKIFTERPVQDLPDEYWYIEENMTTARREQPDTFREETTYSLYFLPNTKDIANTQGRLRDIRRWIETQLMWYPFIANFMFTQEGDVLKTTFSLWRRYRIIPDAPVMMSSLKTETIVSNVKPTI